MWRILVVALACAPLACSEDGGERGPVDVGSSDGAVDGTTDEGNTDTSADSHTGSDAAQDTEPKTCASGCVSVPDGWSGPVLLSVGQPGYLYDCSPGFELQYEGGGALDPGDSYDCEECSCDESGVLCEGITLQLYSDDACATPCDSVALTHGVCSPLSGSCAGGAQRMRYNPQPAYVSGVCEPRPAVQNPQLPTVEWSLRGRACGAVSPSSEGCNAGAFCLPSLLGWSGPCVYAPGRLSCPVEFPFPTVLYEGYVDTRGCSECACSSPQDPCWLEVSVGDTLCAGGASTSRGPDADKCSVMSASAPQSAAQFVAASTCDPSGGERIGELKGDGPTTFCCAQ